MDTADLRVIACQYREGTNIASPGARAYLVGGSNGDGGERRIILVRSRGGRWVEKWEALTKLHNFRLKTVPPEHPQYEALKMQDAAWFAEHYSWLIEAGNTENRKIGV